MNNNELILHFVDKYIVEKRKKIVLQQELEHQKQMQNDIQVKTNKNIKLV